MESSKCHRFCIVHAISRLLLHAVWTLTNIITQKKLKKNIVAAAQLKKSFFPFLLFMCNLFLVHISYHFFFPRVVCFIINKHIPSQLLLNCPVTSFLFLLIAFLYLSLFPHLPFPRQDWTMTSLIPPVIALVCLPLFLSFLQFQCACVVASNHLFPFSSSLAASHTFHSD